MNREEAKYILQAYGVDSQEANDPRFREALEMLKQDQELAHWFSEQRAVDRRLADAFGAFPVPPDLKSKLLAVRKVVIPLPRWWQKPAWLAAAAACLALLATIAALLVHSLSRPQFGDFRSYVSAVASDKSGGLELMNRDVVALRQWLSSRNAPDDFTLPPGLNGRPSLGCRVLEWKGHKVSFVCFELENRQMFHLFVMDGDSLRGMPGMATPEIATWDGITTLSWKDARRVYVLASHQGEEVLRGLL